MTFKGSGTNSITDKYVGGLNTKDYNYGFCGFDGCAVTPKASYWFDDHNGQGLQIVGWALPANFGLSSVTFTQANQDGAIVAGITLAAAPEPAAWAMMLLGVAGVGASVRSRRLRTVG